MSNILRFIKTAFVKCSGEYLVFLFAGSGLVSQAINNIGLGGLETSQNPQTIEMRSVRFSHKQIDNHYTESKQNNSPELLRPLIRLIYYKNQQVQQHRLFFRCCSFSLLLKVDKQICIEVLEVTCFLIFVKIDRQPP